MGNALKCSGTVVKLVFEYTVWAQDEELKWRYPRVNMQELWIGLKEDVTLSWGILALRYARAHEQMLVVRDEALDIGLILVYLLKRLWWIAWQMVGLVEDFYCLAVLVGPRVLKGTLELLERGRAWGHLV